MGKQRGVRESQGDGETAGWGNSGMGKQRDDLFEQDSAFSGWCEQGRDVSMEHPLPRQQIRLFMMMSLQELPQESDNIVYLHCDTPVHT
jgi:hypothetical protein